MFQGIVMSFTDWSMRNRGNINFVGLANYRYILLSDGLSAGYFRKSLFNLLCYVPITMFIGLMIALGMALAVNQFHGRLYGFLRAAFFIPTALPLFLAAGIWMWFMSSDTGLVASILAKIGIGRDIIWKYTPGYAIAFCIIIDVWHSAGFNMIILSTGIRGISRDYYEAAELDGASVFQQMRFITIPLLEPILFLVVINGFISALQVYDVPWILSVSDIKDAGGPAQVMLFPVMEMVRNVYSGDRSALGRASAEGVILMLIIGFITVFQFMMRRRKA
jgi:multiple sugar transport system permease protein